MKNKVTVEGKVREYRNIMCRNATNKYKALYESEGRVSILEEVKKEDLFDNVTFEQIAEGLRK